MRAIIAVLVLYKMSPESSATFLTFSDACARDPLLRDVIDLIIFDNSPEPSEGADSFSGMYLHDGANPGLARRYNQALALAVEHGARWLMLLDQDTELTSEYFAEITGLIAQLTENESVVGFVPRLISGGQVRSPHPPRYRRSPREVDAARGGAAPGLLRAFNSGAVLRVSALSEIGGFPEAYWLDYLDHATFHGLQQTAGRFYVMNAALEHDMSIHRKDRYSNPANSRRHRNQLAAELRFYREHGTIFERLCHRFDLLRQAAGSVRHGRMSESLRLLRAVGSLQNSGHSGIGENR